MNQLRRRASWLKHYLIRTDIRLCEQYLETALSPKLHIGSGPRVIDGWLNSDLNRYSGVFVMDATKPFPFADATFDYVYTEHMIEHISYPSGMQMLNECLRVLKPGGAIRVVTPDLGSLLRLASENLTELERNYLDYFCRAFLPDEEPHNATSALNAHFRSWGHTYVYDEETLRSSMEEAGFANIRRWCLSDSPHKAFVGLANESRYPSGLLDFESVALEGCK